MTYDSMTGITDGIGSRSLGTSTRHGCRCQLCRLAHILYEDILPNKWNVPVSQEEQENIIQISGVYSKGRGNRAGEWHEDSQQKEEQAISRNSQGGRLVFKQEL